MTDSSSPEFWDQRYDAKRMPWDFGDTPSALHEFLQRVPAGNVLIPGCGTAYEVRAFSRAGWVVDAVDFSPEAVRRAQDFLGEPDAARIRLADFFVENLNRPFDLLYKRTFLCSLPPNLWPEYAAQVARCLRPGGALAGFFFFGSEPEPPPYPLDADELGALFGGFTLIEDAPVTDSLPLFAGKERWQVWRKE